jgi:hypothetical protein
MSVKIRPYRRGGWEVDILLRLPSGDRYRERCKAPVASKSGALRWGQDRERHLLQNGPDQPKKEVPTLEGFAARFLNEHARANRQKPSGIAAKDTILRVHLVPRLGSKRLDAITTEDVQQLKVALGNRAAKTVNNVLAVLGVLLKKAVEWGVIDRVPCSIQTGSDSEAIDELLRFWGVRTTHPSRKRIGINLSCRRALGRRSGLALRRDHRPRMVGHRFQQASDVDSTIRMARPRNGSERWAPSVRADDGKVGISPTRTSPPEEPSRGLPS